MIQHDNETLLLPALEAVVQLHQSYQNQIQELQVQIKELVAQNSHLEMLNRTKDRKIAELECLVYPWSSEGEAICNSD